jgi:hypothetical protein
MAKKIGLREAVRLAEGHALGILESTDDLAFWGEEFFDENDISKEWKVFADARRIVMNRIRKAGTR